MSKEYQVLFFTHTGAIKFDRAVKKKNIPCELMPVPRELSSNCSVSAHVYFDGQINDLIDDQIEKIFQNKNTNYILVYEDEK